jgi:hypothetical protein
MFSCTKENGVPVALIIDIDKDTKEEGPMNGQILYLHKDNKAAVDDYDSDSEMDKKHGSRETKAQPEEYGSGSRGNSGKRKRGRGSDNESGEDEPDDSECTKCGCPDHLHDKRGYCPDRRVAETWKRTHEKEVKPARGAGILDSRTRTPYELEGPDAYRSSRESRALSKAELRQLQTKEREPEFEASNGERLSHMKKLHKEAVKNKDKKDGGKRVALKNGCIFRCVPDSNKREVMQNIP